MQTSVPAAVVSGKAIWAGRIISALVVLFLLVDGGMKLIPLDVSSRRRDSWDIQ